MFTLDRQSIKADINHLIGKTINVNFEKNVKNRQKGRTLSICSLYSSVAIFAHTYGEQPLGEM
jgi:uncharacterized protein Veg